MSTAFTLKDWLNNVLNLLGMVSQMEDSKLSYFARDLPIFHFFLFPELAAFKLFFWFKTYLNDPDIDGIDLDLENLPEKVAELIPLSTKIWEAYARTPSEEIWTRETVNIHLKQVLYYHEIGIFKDPSQVVLVLEQYQQVIDIIQKEARVGMKMIDPLGDSNNSAPFDLYYNEVSMGDNSIVFVMGDKKMAFITSSVKIFMNNANPQFCDHMEDYHTNFKRKSTLISNTSEKERVKLFSDIRASIDQHLDQVK